MKKGVFKETVYLRATGGRPSADSSIKRADIDAYIPAVVNYALTKGYYLQIQSEGDRELPGQFSTFFQLPVMRDNKYNGTPYATFPTSLIALPNNRAIRTIADNCDNPFTQLNNAQMRGLNYWLKVFSHKRLYRPIGKDVRFWNIGPLTEFVNTEVIVGVDDLTDDAELPIPAGNEQEALQMCVDFVTGTRQLPADHKNDGRDIN
jgi:hypothetical protein